MPDFVKSKECEKFNNSTVLEGMTSISALISGIRAGINHRKIQAVFFDESKRDSKKKELRFLHAVSEELGFSLQSVKDSDIDRMTVGTSHGGIVAVCSERTLPSLDDLSSLSEDCSPFAQKNGFFAILEGIEDPYNFGYALRSLYACGVDGIILSPRNWMGAAGVVARASAGASELLPMAVSEPALATIHLRQRGYRIVCAGIRDSVSLYDADLKKPILLVVGGEKRGISRTVLDLADQIVRIDYGRAFRGSLSAASAATVLGFEILRQNRGEM